MKSLMSAAGLRSVAVDLFHTIASMPRRRFFWLLVAAGIGYSFGYRDAYRGPESLGWKFGDLVDRVMPASVNEMRRRNSEAIRQRVQGAIELPP